MTRRTRIELALGPFLERMIAARGAAQRGRALLEAALELSRAQAAALWGRAGGSWSPHLSIGEAETLPQIGRVRARLEPGAGDELLRAGELVSCPAGQAWALVLGAVPDRSIEDHIEALLLVHATLAPPDEEAPAPLPFTAPRKN